MEESIQPYGLVLKSNLAIREFLELAVSLANTDSAKILSSAGKYVFSDEVPYTAIRDIWFQIEPSRRPKFSRLLAGASFVLPSPKPREKSKELKDRLERLQEMADRKEYDALVRDVSLKKQDQQYFSSFKDQLGYGRSLQTRLKEHGADIKNERSRTSALAEHSLKTKHHIGLENASIIAREEQYQRRKIREALEIIKHPHNLNRDNGVEISGSWLPLIKEIKSARTSR